MPIDGFVNFFNLQEQIISQLVDKGVVSRNQPTAQPTVVAGDLPN